MACHILCSNPADFPDMTCRINNAGSNGYKYGVLGDYTDAELVNIVETNVLGVMLGCREVMNALRLPVWKHSYKQPG